MTTCQRCSKPAEFAVCLTDGPDEHCIEWWCETCVEGVVHGLDDAGAADRHVAHAWIPGGAQ